MPAHIRKGAKETSAIKFILCGYGEEEVSYRQLIRHLGIEESVIICARTDVEEVMTAHRRIPFLCPIAAKALGW